MTYVPLAANAINPGIQMDTVFADLGTAHDEIYRDAAPWIGSAFGMETTPNERSATFVNHFKFRLRRNADDEKIRFYFLARVVHPAGNGEIRGQVIGSATSSVVITVTNTVFAWHTFDLTPTGTGPSPREISIDLRDTNTRGIEVSALTIFFYQRTGAGVPSGILDSGFSEWHSICSAADEPINTERVSRLIRGPYQIARDRPATLYCWAKSLQEDGDQVTTSADFATVFWGGFAGDQYVRDYRVDIYVTATFSAVATIRLTVDGAQKELVGTGLAGEWLTETFSTGAAYPIIQVEMKKTGGGLSRVGINTIQLAREVA